MQRRHLSPAAALILALCAGALPGCDDSKSAYCVRDTDCAANERCADGVCTLKLLADSGDDGLTGDLGPGDGQSDSGDALASDALTDTAPSHDGLTCKANNDDVIARDEMPIVSGRSVSYTIGTGLTVNLVGSKKAGRTHWSLKANAADDKKTVADLLEVFAWAKGDYPNATYATLIGEKENAYGVFQATPTALSLLGVISKDKAVPFVSGIDLPYGKPIDMLRFPVDKSLDYVSSATATGYFNGPYLYVTEEYAVKTLDVGELELPQITFPVVLVKVAIKQTPYANPFLVSRRTVFMFLSECYGIVGRIVVGDEVKEKDHGAVVADERWRLSF